MSDEASISHDKKWLILRYGGYNYDISWSRIQTHEHLLEWVRHLSEKSWMNTHRIIELINYVEAVKGWEIKCP